MECYHSTSEKYRLIGKPEFHPFLSKSAVLSSADLQDGKVYYAIPDKRADRIRLILKSGCLDLPEFLKMLIPASVPLNLSAELNSNWWFECHPWVVEKSEMEFPLSVLVLSEDFLAAGDTERKMDSYVRFYEPFVVAVVQSRMHSGTHGQLFKDYDGFYQLKMPGYSENTFCLYYHTNQVVVLGSHSDGKEVVDILRRSNVGSALKIKRARVDGAGTSNVH